MHAMVGYFKYLASNNIESPIVSSEKAIGALDEKHPEDEKSPPSSDKKQPEASATSSTTTRPSPLKRLTPLAASRRPAVVWPSRDEIRAAKAAAKGGGRSPGSEHSSSSDDEKGVFCDGFCVQYK